MGERPSIFGLETEYVILYVPDEPGEAARPPFALLQDVIFSTLLAERKAGLSGGIKRGYFLQNGGLIHLEIYLRHQGDTPILEASTPECRSPEDLLVYARAYDHLLEEISRKSRPVLAERGFRGMLAFGKNNRDSYGVGFGCHENYLVHVSPRRWERLLLFASLPVIIFSLLPALALFVAVLLAAFLYLFLARIIPPIEDLARHGYAKLRARERLWQNLLAVYHLGSNLILLPSIWLYTATLRMVAVRPFTRHLTSFLVTRQIYGGSGALDFERGVYEISQRAGLTTSVSNIIMFGRGKTMFDLKGLLYEPLSLLRRSKKLTITLGDSNLSDVPVLLRLGATALLIEMIENGESFSDLRLARPVQTFRTISREGPWKRLELECGRARTAVAVQREYLARARRYVGGRPEGRARHQRVLDLWEEVLQGMEDRLQGLAGRVEWIAKKSLLDGAVLAGSDWKTFFAWGRIFALAGLEASDQASSLSDLAARSSKRIARRIAREAARGGLRPGDFPLQRRLYFQARKIDLRFHELSAEGGYQRTLEREGLIDRLTSDDEVDRASREPPPDTRARIRGYYIRLSPDPDAIHAGWSEVELLRPFRLIALPDPFAHGLPGDEG